PGVVEAERGVGADGHLELRDGARGGGLGRRLLRVGWRGRRRGDRVGLGGRGGGQQGVRLLPRRGGDRCFGRGGRPAPGGGASVQAGAGQGAAGQLRLGRRAAAQQQAGGEREQGRPGRGEAQLVPWHQ